MAMDSYSMSTNKSESKSEEWIRKHSPSLLRHRSLFARIPKLLVLDIDGTLIVETESAKEIVFRPGLNAFFYFATQLGYEFAIWTARKDKYVPEVTRQLFAEHPHLKKLQFVWTQQ